MKGKRRVKPHDRPLHEALAAAEAAIRSNASPAARVAAALAVLADGLAKVLADSDTSSSRASAAAGTNQALARHRQSQDDRIAEIRKASSDAEGASMAELGELSTGARTSAKSALRSQVRKLRLRRRSGEDGPGGES